MSSEIGFVIVSHNYPQQLLRLVCSLQRFYDNPLIAIHHDVSQSPIRYGEFPPDVKFVAPHTKTRWGHFSVLTASLRGLELLYANAQPKWFFLLSGADYPVMPADMVLRELSKNEVDALLDYREVGSLEPPDNPALWQFCRAENAELARRRYVAWRLCLPVVRRGPRIGAKCLYLPIRSWGAPFNSQFKCFFGDFWFAGNSKVASVLLNPSKRHVQLRRHLRLRQCPEECYYHSVLANTPSLKISKATRRFAQWDGGAHPKFLDMEAFPAIIRSNAYFARKFLHNAPVLDEIDRLLGYPPERASELGRVLINPVL